MLPADLGGHQASAKEKYFGVVKMKFNGNMLVSVLDLDIIPQTKATGLVNFPKAEKKPCLVEFTTFACHSLMPSDDALARPL